MELLGSIGINALLISILLFLIFRHQADYNLTKVVMVTAIISIVPWVLTAVFWTLMPWWLAVPLALLLTWPASAFVLSRLCWVPYWGGILIVFLCYLINAGIYVLFAVMLARSALRMVLQQM